MPGGMSGLELAQAVLAIRPDAAVVIASGAIDAAEVQRAAAIGVRTVIQKPAKVAEMAGYRVRAAPRSAILTTTMVYSGFYRRCFLVATAAILAYLLLAVLAPLRGALSWAAVLAFLLYPLHERLSRRLKGRSVLSAGIITGLTPFLVLAPLAVLGVVFAGQVASLIGYLRGQSSLGYPQLLARLESYPLIGTRAALVRAPTSR